MGKEPRRLGFRLARPPTEPPLRQPLLAEPVALAIELCGAPHNSIYVETSVMWSLEMRGCPGAGLGPCQPPKLLTPLRDKTPDPLDARQAGGGGAEADRSPPAPRPGSPGGDFRPWG